MSRASLEPDMHALAIQRAAWKCERCGAHVSAARVEVHHVLGRQPVALVNCSDNLVALCRGCHEYAHSNKPAFLAWFAGQFGEDRLAKLYAMRRGTKLTIGGRT